jgi:hypothetical protein
MRGSMRHYFSHNPRLRRVQLDLLLMEVFGARYLPDEVAARIRARAERETVFMHGIRRGIARQEIGEMRWRTKVLTRGAQ